MDTPFRTLLVVVVVVTAGLAATAVAICPAAALSPGLADSYGTKVATGPWADPIGIGRPAEPADLSLENPYSSKVATGPWADPFGVRLA